MTIPKTPANAEQNRHFVDTLLYLVAGSAMILVSFTFLAWLRT